jgi:hypothetical protein
VVEPAYDSGDLDLARKWERIENKHATGRFLIGGEGGQVENDSRRIIILFKQCSWILNYDEEPMITERQIK